MRRLIWDFAGRTYHFVGNLMHWLKYDWFFIVINAERLFIFWFKMCLSWENALLHTYCYACNRKPRLMFVGSRIHQFIMYLLIWTPWEQKVCRVTIWPVNNISNPQWLSLLPILRRRFCCVWFTVWCCSLDVLSLFCDVVLCCLLNFVIILLCRRERFAIL